MPLDETNQAEFDELHTQIHEAIHADHEVRWMQTVGGFSGRRMPEQGMFVKTGPHGGSMRGSIGWVAQVAANRWNAEADEFNHWDVLGQDEKDELIAAEQERLASTESVGVNPSNVEKHGKVDHEHTSPIRPRASY